MGPNEDTMPPDLDFAGFWPMVYARSPCLICGKPTAERSVGYEQPMHHDCDPIHRGTMTLDTTIWDTSGINDEQFERAIVRRKADAHMGYAAPHFIVYPDGNFFPVSSLGVRERELMPRSNANRTVEFLVAVGWRATNSLFLPSGWTKGPESRFEPYYPAKADHGDGVTTKPDAGLVVNKADATIDLPDGLTLIDGETVYTASAAQVTALEALDVVRDTLSATSHQRRAVLDAAEREITKAFESA